MYIDGSMHEYQGYFQNSSLLKGCLIETWLWQLLFHVNFFLCCMVLSSQCLQNQELLFANIALKSLHCYRNWFCSKQLHLIPFLYSVLQAVQADLKKLKELETTNETLQKELSKLEKAREDTEKLVSKFDFRGLTLSSVICSRREARL